MIPWLRAWLGAAWHLWKRRHLMGDEPWASIDAEILRKEGRAMAVHSVPFPAVVPLSTRTDTSFTTVEELIADKEGRR